MDFRRFPISISTDVVKSQICSYATLGTPAAKEISVINLRPRAIRNYPFTHLSPALSVINLFPRVIHSTIKKGVVWIQSVNSLRP